MTVDRSVMNYQMTDQLVWTSSYLGAVDGLHLRVPFITPAAEAHAIKMGRNPQALHVNYAFPKSTATVSEANDKIWITVKIDADGLGTAVAQHGRLPTNERGQVAYTQEVLAKVTEQAVLGSQSALFAPVDQQAQGSILSA